jgi:hypothetical protein
MINGLEITDKWRHILRRRLSILDTAARGVWEFAADAAWFKDFVDHCVLTSSYVFMISKEYYHIFRPEFLIYCNGPSPLNGQLVTDVISVVTDTDSYSKYPRQPLAIPGINPLLRIVIGQKRFTSNECIRMRSERLEEVTSIPFATCYFRLDPDTSS